MKTYIALESFDDSPLREAQIRDASFRAAPELPPRPDDPTGEDFRELLRRRETTPFVIAIPYHRWGINE